MLEVGFDLDELQEKEITQWGRVRIFTCSPHQSSPTG